MDDSSTSDPLRTLLAMAGVELGGWETVPVDDLNRALNLIATPSEQMERARQAVCNALFKSRIRLPAIGRHVKAAEIHAALEAVEHGLGQIAKGLETIAFARQTAAAGSDSRTEALADVHRFAIGAICAALPMSFNISDETIANSVPEYDRFGFDDGWRGRFAAASRQVNRGKGAWSNGDLSLRRPQATERNDLLADLANIFEKITGNRATAWRPNGNMPERAKSDFHAFIEILWPITGEGLPSAEIIHAAIPNPSRVLLAQSGER